MATRRRSRSSGMGLSKWNVYAGGTGAAPGKRSYDVEIGDWRAGGKKYDISPYTTQWGRHAGYFLSVFPGSHSGHAGIGPDGGEVMLNSRASTFRSPQAAAKAARAHMARRRG